MIQIVTGSFIHKLQQGLPKVFIAPIGFIVIFIFTAHPKGAINDDAISNHYT